MGFHFIRGRCVFLKNYHQIDDFISKIETLESRPHPLLLRIETTEARRG